MPEHRVAIATARAGNVIGGGDWAADRLVPDCLRAIEAGTPLALRFPDAVRPWQHVLDPLAGYLDAGGAPACRRGGLRRGLELRSLRRGRATGSLGRRAAGPRLRRPRCPGSSSRRRSRTRRASLRLDCSKARSRLGWQARWPLAVALEKICAWHRAFGSGANMRDFTLAQIGEFEAALR